MNDEKMECAQCDRHIESDERVYCIDCTNKHIQQIENLLSEINALQNEL